MNMPRGMLGRERADEPSEIIRERAATLRSSAKHADTSHRAMVLSFARGPKFGRTDNQGTL